MTNLKKSIALLTMCCSIAAAADNNSPDSVSNNGVAALRGIIQSMNEELSNQRAAIGALNAELEASNSENTRINRQILNELKAMQRRNQSVFDSLASSKALQGDGNEIKPLRNYDLQTPDGKMILGGDEFVYVKEANASIDARIDTGATVSSISAQNIVRFERNGHKWIRFDINANDRTITVEAPFVRQSRILQSQSEAFSYRPVIRLNIKIADYSVAAEFNLIDRTHLQYSLLIGRNVLTDIAVVDVSRRQIQPRADKDGLVILRIDDYAAAKKQGINPNEKYDKKRSADAEGMIATPAADSSERLGTDSEKNLPSVSRIASAKDDADTKSAQQSSKKDDNSKAQASNDQASKDKNTDNK